MSRTICHMSTSLDVFGAGPAQDRSNPAGVGGLSLHACPGHASEPGHETEAGPRDALIGRGDAHLMGPHVGPARGEWDETWRGSWGEELPHHPPVFHHHARDPIEIDGRTMFCFVTNGFDATRRAEKA